MFRNPFWLLVLTFLTLFIFIPSYARLQDLKQKNLGYQRKITELTKINAQLIEERRLLEHDPVYIEKVAREKMGLVREGEVVYKIEPSPAVE